MTDRETDEAPDGLNDCCGIHNMIDTSGHLTDFTSFWAIIKFLFFFIPTAICPTIFFFLTSIAPSHTSIFFYLSLTFSHTVYAFSPPQSAGCLMDSVEGDKREWPSDDIAIKGSLLPSRILSAWWPPQIRGQINSVWRNVRVCPGVGLKSKLG